MFITVGTQKFPFNRLFKYIDQLIEENIIDKERVFAQIGTSTYLPQNYKYVRFLDEVSFNEYYSKTEVIITHAGTASIVSGLNSNKKLIIIPRESEKGEHVDDHQFEIAKLYHDMNYCFKVNTYQELAEKINIIETHNFKQFESNQNEFLSKLENMI